MFARNTSKSSSPIIETIEHDLPVHIFVDYCSKVNENESIYLRREDERVARKEAWNCVFRYCCCCLLEDPNPSECLDMLLLLSCYLISSSCQFFYYCPSSTIFRMKNCFGLFCNSLKEMNSKPENYSIKDLKTIMSNSCDQDVLARYENSQNEISDFIKNEIKRPVSLSMTRE